MTCEKCKILEETNDRLREALKKAPTQYLTRMQELKAQVNALQEKLDKYEA